MMFKKQRVNPYDFSWGMQHNSCFQTAPALCPARFDFIFLLILMINRPHGWFMILFFKP